LTLVLSDKEIERALTMDLCIVTQNALPCAGAQVGKALGS
jgi:hypothetical protein